MTPAEAALLDQLISQGLAYWQQLEARKTAGQATRADLEEAAAKLDADIDALIAARAAQKAQGG